MSLGFSFPFQPHQHAWQGSCLGGVAGCRGPVRRFPSTGIGRRSGSLQGARGLSVPLHRPNAAGAWGMVSAPEASLLRVSTLMAFNEDMKSPSSFRLSPVRWLKVEVAFPRINPHFQKWLVKLCSLWPLLAETVWDLNY